MVDFDRFLAWAESRFDNVVVKGNEIKLNSIFAEDHKNHMWCNPYGGKKNRPNGVFHCWKTDIKGSLISLIMQVDNCIFEEAIEILGGADTRLAELERRVQELFDSSSKKKKVEKAKEKPEEIKELRLPSFTYTFDDLPSISHHRVRAEVYLFQRRLPTNHFLVCTAGEYKHRIIIPYYDRNGQLIYFNSRHIGNSQTALRYKGPDDEKVGVGKGDVLYFPEWPKKGSRVFLAEGEFDGMSIRVTGLPGGAFGGKALTETQIQILRDNNYLPTICLDTDKAGRASLPRMGDNLLHAGFSKVRFVRPPVQHKDWNGFLQKHGPRILRAYILSRAKEYSEWTSTNLNMQQI